MYQQSSYHRANRAVLQINTILSLFLVLGYVVELLKHQKPQSYVLTFSIIVAIPIAAAMVVFFRDPNSKALKYITLGGYFIMYIFVMFTATRLLVYVYLFPIIMMYFLYFNIRLITASCGLVFVINVAKIGNDIFIKKLNEQSIITDYTIQFASVFLFCLALIIATRLSNELSRESLEKIEEEKKKQTAILEDVLKIASTLDQNSKKVYEIFEELSNSTLSVNCALKEISNGVAATSDSLQEQSGMTNSIHDLIADTSQISREMGDISRESAAALAEGVEMVTSLTDKNTIVNQNSDNVYSAMLELSEKSNEIQSITNIIAGISEQTNLLSLNAAIESARAGEAGKGFAVVAGEIRKLAEQSHESSGSISRIIHELKEKADASVKAVEGLKGVNKEQSLLIEKTRDLFEIVIQKMKEVDSNVALVSGKISEILTANDKIVGSIDEISATSEQVTASSQEASSISSVTLEQSSKVKELVTELVDTSKKMDKYISKN